MSALVFKLTAQQKANDTSSAPQVMTTDAVEYKLGAVRSMLKSRHGQKYALTSKSATWTLPH